MVVSRTSQRISLLELSEHPKQLRLAEFLLGLIKARVNRAPEVDPDLVDAFFLDLLCLLIKIWFIGLIFSLIVSIVDIFLVFVFGFEEGIHVGFFSLVFQEFA